MSEFIGQSGSSRRSFLKSMAGTVGAMAVDTGDFSALLGKQVGIDSLGRPEYANEIYDPATSRPDPKIKCAIIRDPFPGNIIPKARLNPAALLIAQKYYPAPI